MHLCFHMMCGAGTAVAGQVRGCVQARLEGSTWCAWMRCSRSAMRVRSAASAGRSTGLPSSLGSSARSAGSIWCSSTHCLRAPHAIAASGMCWMRRSCRQDGHGLCLLSFMHTQADTPKWLCTADTAESQAHRHPNYSFYMFGCLRSLGLCLQAPTTVESSRTYTFTQVRT